ELAAAVDRALRSERTASWLWKPSAALRGHLDAVRDALPSGWRDGVADQAVALWALTCIDEEAEDSDELVGIPPELRTIVKSELRNAKASTLDDEAVLARWTWLDKQLAAHAVKPSAIKARTRTERIDRILLHRVVGFLVFMGVMTLLFMSLFAWADP